MAETMEPENAAFWLPTHFLTDDDFLSDDLHFRKPNLNTTNTNNNFDLFSSSLDSPVSSTETERGDTNINDDAVTKDLDDDDFLAELTRHLAHSSLHDSKGNSQKPWVFSTSPQSTLSGFGPWSNRSGFSSNGSPNGPSRVPSPPVTPPPKNDPAWDLLYEAAGQVARLKINALAAQLNHHHQQQQQNRGLLSAPRNVSLSSKPTHHHLNSFYDYPLQFEQVKRQGNENFYCQHHNHHHRRGCGGGPLGLPQSAWPALRPNHHRQSSTGPRTRPAFHNGPGVVHMPGVKRQSAGTGVFLPRRAGTTHQPAPPPEPRKKPNANNSPVLLPARVVQALNLDLEEMNNGVNPNANHHPRFGAGMLSDHDILVARRNAILEQQRRSLISRNEAAATMVGHEIRLPSDWTY